MVRNSANHLLRESYSSAFSSWWWPSKVTVGPVVYLATRAVHTGGPAQSHHHLLPTSHRPVTRRFLHSVLSQRYTPRHVYDASDGRRMARLASIRSTHYLWAPHPPLHPPELSAGGSFGECCNAHVETLGADTHFNACRNLCPELPNKRHPSCQ